MKIISVPRAEVLTAFLCLRVEISAILIYIRTYYVSKINKSFSEKNEIVYDFSKMFSFPK